MHRYTMIAMTAAALLLGGCSDADSQANAGAAAAQQVALDPGFGAYWYQGKAEVTRYALDQARYGEMHHGDAVLIFVTEDFLADRQVKLESDPAGRNAVKVLKCNLTKKFVTGIYPYSMMSSIFTPVDLSAQPHTLKVTTSSQEWCGHTFTQFNWRGTKYDLELRSYFEKEGDQNVELEVAMLEDEVWTRIRLAPASLPTGSIRIIPGSLAQRLRHTQFAVETANATLAPVADAPATSPALMRYTLIYGASKRTLAIDFEKNFPHRIMAWSETYPDGFDAKAPMLTTHAVRTNELMIDYWTKHSNADDSLRKELGLP